MDNRPKSREKNVTDNSKGVEKRPMNSGAGQGGGGGRPQQINPRPSSGGGMSTRAKAGAGGGSAVLILIIIFVLKACMGGSVQTGYDDSQYGQATEQLQTSGQNGGQADGQSQGVVSFGQSTQDNYVGTLVSNNKPDGTANAGVLNSVVPEGCRDKYTTIYGDGTDKVTFLIYMCGTDLESRGGMATKDLMEMTKATLNDNINIIVYTGGCKQWNNSVISSSTNQIWKIENGGLKCLVKDDGAKAMTDPSTLASFIKWGAKNYPANRMNLIMWDHGGGAITGYGYDEKNANSGSMTLSLMDQALSSAGVKFDFIGFDACLMATLENGLTMEPYADYMIASEETEPGVGWYYTNWLTKLANDTSMPTVELGKNIIDDYVAECNRSCNGQKTCLSIVDLGELKSKVPDKLNLFASSINTMLEENQYKQISDARYQTREFAQSSQIDHVDLVNLAQNINTAEGHKLADAILSCVKYNRTSSNMTNAYGVSIYFPYRKVNKVDNAVKTYNALGMDSEYTKCIRSFAQVETSGQMSSYGTSDPLGSLLGSGNGSNTINTVANLFEFLANRDIPEGQVDDYVADNTFDTTCLNWKEVDGKQVIAMSEEQWSLVHDITVNMFYDDGTGYIDLGNDNLFEFDADGNLIGDQEPTWLAIDGQPVAYYYMDTVMDGDEYTITGRVPVLLNGDRTNLILIFDNEHPYGYIAGARTDYAESETETVAKSLVQLSAGDKLDFICNFYDYDGNFQEEYFIGEQMTLSEEPVISNVSIGDSVIVTYKFTDIYNQTYWTSVVPKN